MLPRPDRARISSPTDPTLKFQFETKNKTKYKATDTDTDTIPNKKY